MLARYIKQTVLNLYVVLYNSFTCITLSYDLHTTRVGQYLKYYTVITATESLWLLSWYCIGIYIFYYKNRAQHHYTCVPLETTIASLFIGMNLWILIVVVGTNLISTLYWSIVMFIMWQYSVIYCSCDIIEMWKFLQYWYCRP